MAELADAHALGACSLVECGFDPLRVHYNGDCSSAGRAADCGSAGRGFEPRQSPLQKGELLWQEMERS